MIAIVDYGLGNLRSVQKAFNKVGYDAVITGNKNLIESASHIVLPGVGAFPDAINLLRSSGLDKIVIGEANKGKPILGICLGMQLLFESSAESGIHKGLGLIKGNITRFDIDLKVPQVGWNSVKVAKPSRLLDGVDGEYFYFVHSFCASEINDETCGITDYCVEFTSAVENKNVFGVQFHPEKSSESGLRILKNFAEISNQG